MEDMIALAASRDPIRAVELELLFGIRRSIERASTILVIGLIVGGIMGYIALTLLSRL